MRRIVVVLGVAALMAAMVALPAGAVLAQAETEKYQEKMPLTFTDYNPCTGEEILWEGIWTGNIHVTTNENGRHVASSFHTIHLTGTGLETGDQYRAVGASGVREHQLINRRSELHRYIYSETGTGLTISKGDTPNFIGRYQVIVTPNKYVEVLSRDCTANVEPQWPDEPVE